MLCIRNTFKINIIYISLPDLTVSCVQGAVSGRTTLQCSTSNNITSTTCSFDGQPAQPCSLPLQLLFSEYGPGNHTVLITFTDEFGQTLSTLQTFSVSPPDINFKCTTSGNLEEQTITCTTSTPINSTTCAYDGEPAEACTLPVTVSYSQFSAGSHTLVITVTDSYGQTGTTKFDFTVSETIPGQLIINTLNIFCVYCLLNVCNKYAMYKEHV